MNMKQQNNAEIKAVMQGPDVPMNTKKQNSNPCIPYIAVAAVIAMILLAVFAGRICLRSDPTTIETLMTSLGIPETIPADRMREAALEDFQAKFGGTYGIDLETDETAYFTKLLDDVPFEIRQTDLIRGALLRECADRRITEESMIRQIVGIPDDAEREKIRKEWSAAGVRAALDSEDFHRVMEPVYADFFAWWTKRHPVYEGIAAAVVITDDHDALAEQLAVSLWRETLVNLAQQLETRLETDLRKRGKVLSDAKRKRTFMLFLRLSRERYTYDMMRKMADAIIKDAELSDGEILHCMLLKDQTLSDKRLAIIQDIPARFLTPGILNEIPPETMAEIQKELEDITGIGYGTR